MNKGRLLTAMVFGALFAVASLLCVAENASAGFGDALTGGLQKAEALKHATEAANHATQAVDAGGKGQLDQLVIHAAEAKTHADAAKNGGLVNAHLDEGIKALDEAAVSGKAGNLAQALVATKNAVTHLSQVK